MVDSHMHTFVRHCARIFIIEHIISAAQSMNVARECVIIWNLIKAATFFISEPQVFFSWFLKELWYYGNIFNINSCQQAKYLSVLKEHPAAECESEIERRKFMTALSEDLKRRQEIT